MPFPNNLISSLPLSLSCVSFLRRPLSYPARRFLTGAGAGAGYGALKKKGLGGKETEKGLGRTERKRGEETLPPPLQHWKKRKPEKRKGTKAVPACTGVVESTACLSEYAPVVSGSVLFPLVATKRMVLVVVVSFNSFLYNGVLVLKKADKS